MTPPSPTRLYAQRTVQTMLAGQAVAVMALLIDPEEIGRAGGAIAGSLLTAIGEDHGDDTTP